MSETPRTANSLAVFAGGVVGSALRVSVGDLFPPTTGGFPLTVLVINLVGSFILGVYLGRQEYRPGRSWSRPFWAAGLLGSFTTFSAFSLDVVFLVSAQSALAAVVYVIGSVAGGVAVAWGGLRAGRSLR
ncbi:MAG TPA: CrcB family protein [Acidimicrobiia bacterium]|nr:CrcB family protein [Acidimicrobiia bacterium]